MRFILPFILFYVVLTACSPETNQREKQSSDYTIEERLRVDSAFGFKLGDVFLADSLKSYGFILVEIEKESEALSFIPVKLLPSKTDLGKIVMGNIRLVPLSPENPDNGTYGVECMGAMGDKQLKEVKEKFHWIGNLKLKQPFLPIVSVSYGTLSAEGLNSFARNYEHNWEGQSKIIKTSVITE